MVETDHKRVDALLERIVPTVVLEILIQMTQPYVITTVAGVVMVYVMMEGLSQRKGDVGLDLTELTAGVDLIRARTRTRTRSRIQKITWHVQAMMTVSRMSYVIKAPVG